MPAPDPIQVRDRSGQVVGRRYRLERVLGRGGQGVVYEALDLKAGDRCAVKILNEELARDAEFRERMFREARAMTLLAGTAAVRALDQVWTDDGCLCLVMELLEGRDLEDLLQGVESGGRLAPLGPILETLEPVARTLHLAHEHGIVHRDLKPGNIFCISPERGGGVRLLDFGFARFTRAPALTRAEFVAGSPSYISPEAWRGQPVDHRADIYALGAVVFRALGGRPPFVHEDLGALLRQVTNGPRPSLRALRPELPAAMDDWVAQALAIRPEDRFLRVGAMWSALQAALTG